MTLPRNYNQFGVYETFAPTTLRRRSAVLLGTDMTWRAELPPVLSMELARVGAHLTLVAPDRSVYQPVARDITTYGRPVHEVDGVIDGAGAMAAALAAYERLDLVVTLGPELEPALLRAACEAMAARDGGAVVALAAPERRGMLEDIVGGLSGLFHQRGVRVNGVVAPVVAAEEGGPSAQEVAWQVVFLASQGGQALTGHVLQPTATTPRD